MHWLRWSDFRPRLGPAAAEPDRAGMPEGARHHAADRNGQRQRHPGARHLGGPVRDRAGHHSGAQQLAAALYRQPRRCQRRRRQARRRRRAAITRSQRRSRPSAANGSACRGASAAGSSPIANPGLHEIGYDKFPGHLGQAAGGRQDPEGQRPSDRPGAEPLVWRPARLLVSVAVVVGRQGGRSRRQDRGARQQGNRRVGQVRGRRSGTTPATRAASPGTIRATTAPFCPAASAPPTTAPRSISRPSASRMSTRPKRARRCIRTSCTRRCPKVRAASTTCLARSPTC